ncbi:MAG: hypothetical protein JSW67_05680 [Candidatus Latescibacterota bacterium]|nr:MAG: hypothetical protein JSW67_05680 [Candidatus Latescibacterota bacterium]
MSSRGRSEATQHNSMLTPFRQGTVLLLTQNEQLAGIVSHAIESLEPNVPRLSTVRNASDCFVALRLLGPSLVVLDDASDPDAGVELLERLLQARPKTPVVYVTSHHTIELEREVRRRGVLFYVEMPSSHEALDMALTRLLGSLVRDTPERDKS